MALEKIVSGGQSGADRAALDWAIAHRLAHGGWCPKGRKAEDGIIAARYELQETPSADYAQRTEWNVRDSDGTVVISISATLAGGSKETVRFAKELKKPVLHISRETTPQPGRALAAFLREQNIRVLNVAGPRASEELEIAEFIHEILDTFLTGTDASRVSANMFHRQAEAYRDKFMGQALYEHCFRRFCELLPGGKARVLDVACGPGNVAQVLKTLRPDLDLLGIDLAPRMVELAREAVPDARFLVHDLRRIGELGGGFHGIICAFGLPYISHSEATGFLGAAAQALMPEGVIYVSTMLGRQEDSGWHRSSSGEEVYVTYHTENELVRVLVEAGFQIAWNTHLESPSAASKKTTDLIVIARR